MADPILLREANGRFASVQKLISQMQNPAPLLDIIGKLLKASTEKRITTTKLDPQGRAWKPWSFATFLARSKKGNAGRGLLYDSGNLARNISYTVQGQQVLVGVNAGAAPYARFLQSGTPNMPARPFVGISADDNQAIRLAVQQYLTKN